MPNSLLEQMVSRTPLVCGSDTDIQFVGAHSWVRKALGIEMEGEQTGNLTLALYFRCMPDETEQTTSGVLSTSYRKQTFQIFVTVPLSIPRMGPAWLFPVRVTQSVCTPSYRTRMW